MVREWPVALWPIKRVLEVLIETIPQNTVKQLPMILLIIGLTAQEEIPIFLLIMVGSLRHMPQIINQREERLVSGNQGKDNLCIKLDQMVPAVNVLVIFQMDQAGTVTYRKYINIIRLFNKFDWLYSRTNGGFYPA